jgi:hypothetical protein
MLELIKMKTKKISDESCFKQSIELFLMNVPVQVRVSRLREAARNRRGPCQDQDNHGHH